MTETADTSDRKWLYEEVIKFIGRVSEWDRQCGRTSSSKTDRMIWQHFCGMHGSNTGRESWDRKKRHTKRAMLRSAIRRLVRDGRIKVETEESLNLRSMNSMDRRNLDHRRRMFGKEYDGMVRTYSKLDVLEGIVHALEASE